MKRLFHFSTLAMLVWLLLIAQFAVAQQPKKKDKPEIPPIPSVVPEGRLVLSMKLLERDSLLVYAEEAEQTLKVQLYVLRKYKILKNSNYQDSMAIVPALLQSIALNPETYNAPISKEGKAIFDTTQQAKDEAPKLRATIKLTKVKENNRQVSKLKISLEYYRRWSDTNPKKRKNDVFLGYSWDGESFSYKATERDRLGLRSVELNEFEKLYFELFREGDKPKFGFGYEDEESGSSELLIYSDTINRMGTDTIFVNSRTLNEMYRTPDSLKKHFAVNVKRYVRRDTLFVLCEINRKKLPEIYFYLLGRNRNAPTVRVEVRRETPPSDDASLLFPQDGNVDPYAVANKIQEVAGNRAKVVGLTTKEHVQGKKGTWIKITYTPSRAGRFLFDAGKYTMNTSEQEILDGLIQDVYNFLDDEDKQRAKNGGSTTSRGKKTPSFPYELYFLGSADIAGDATFYDYQSNYDKQYYTVKHHLWSPSMGMYEANTSDYIIGDKYFNTNLPNLRASRAKDAFAKRKSPYFPVDKLHILEGKVKPVHDIELRNVTVYLFIDNIEKR